MALGAVGYACEVLHMLNRVVAQPFTQAIGAILLAYLVSSFGLAAYFHQRNADRARQRFVEDGIDIYAANLDAILSVQRHNWQMMLRYLKLIRDAPKTVVADELFESLRHLDARYLSVVSAKRVTNLLGENLFWAGYQKLYSFVGTKADFIAGDFGSALRSLVDNPDNPNKDAFVEEAEQSATEMGEQAEPMYVFLSEVAEIATLADLHIFNRKTVSAFKTRKDVREIVERLKNRFPDWTEGAAEAR
jgi:hypothetical protein